MLGGRNLQPTLLQWRYRITGAVFTGTEGSYLLRYDCSDHGFTVSATRLVIVMRRCGARSIA
eukprot:5297347-Amphidinium_carterae.1